MSRDPNSFRKPVTQMPPATTAPASVENAPAPLVLQPVTTDAPSAANPPAVTPEMVFDLSALAEHFPLSVLIQSVWAMYGSAEYVSGHERKKRLIYAILTLVDKGEQWLIDSFPGGVTARELVGYALNNPWTDAQEQRMAEPLAEVLDECIQSIHDGVKFLRDALGPVVGYGQ